MPAIRQQQKSSKKLPGRALGSFFIFSASAGVLTPSTGQAWYDHASLAPWIVRSIEAEFQKDPNHPYTKLRRQAPKRTDPYATIREYRNLADLLLLNPRAKLRSVSAATVTELLTLAPDDPDHGMDQDLPDSADPQNERRYMGGHNDSSSQGFRHMYFAGFNWRDPISTFQVPPHPLGQAMDRFTLLVQEGKSRIQSGDTWWGLRIIGWSLHYLQDLTQPFHTNQIPNLRMLPLTALLHWPPTQAWDNFKAETTRVVENYHWVYEGYVREALLKGDQGAFENCLTGTTSTLLVSSPRELIEEVVRGSRSRSARMGSALMELAGTQLKRSEFHLSKKEGTIDYEALRTDPDREAARRSLHEVTCESLSLAKSASLWTLKWAFRR